MSNLIVSTKLNENLPTDGLSNASCSSGRRHAPTNCATKAAVSSAIIASLMSGALRFPIEGGMDTHAIEHTCLGPNPNSGIVDG